MSNLVAKLESSQEETFMAWHASGQLYCRGLHLHAGTIVVPVSRITPCTPALTPLSRSSNQSNFYLDP